MDKLNPAALERASHPKKSPKPDPITDPRAVLEILSAWSHRTSSKLCVGRFSKESEIEMITDSRGPGYTSVERLPVSDECVDNLLTNKWVILSYGRYEYSVSIKGSAQIEAWRQEDIIRAHEIIRTVGTLPPEVWCHTFEAYGRRWHNLDDQRDGIYLVNAVGEGFIVYVETGKVVRHDEESFARNYLTPSSYTLVGMTYFQGRQVAHFRNSKTGSEVVFSPDDLKYHTFAPE